MTLEDISILFGDPVEISFEQAMNKEQGARDAPGDDIKGDVELVEGVAKAG